MSAKAKAEEFIYDIFKLAIVEVCFKYVEMFKLGFGASLVILLLIVLKHFGKLHMPRRTPHVD